MRLPATFSGEMRIQICIGCFSGRSDRIPGGSLLREGRGIPPAHGLKRDIANNGKEVMVGAVCGSWPHGICSQEAAADQE